jgi:hypothetical protein
MRQIEWPELMRLRDLSLPSVDPELSSSVGSSFDMWQGVLLILLIGDSLELFCLVKFIKVGRYFSTDFLVTILVLF